MSKRALAVVAILGVAVWVLAVPSKAQPGKFHPGPRGPGTPNRPISGAQPLSSTLRLRPEGRAGLKPNGVQYLQAAPEKPKRGAGTKYPFAPGKFLTADDYEHVTAALNYVDLKPEDLSFDKQVAPGQRFVLPICAQCLDNPLGVPKVAEDAAARFRREGASKEDRAKWAGQLLRASEDRWSDEARSIDAEATKDLYDDLNEAAARLPKLPKDEKEAAKVRESKEYKDVMAEIDANYAKIRSFGATLICGGELTELVAVLADDDWAYRGHRGDDLIAYIVAAATTLKRRAGKVSSTDVATVAALLPNQMAEAEVGIPGASAADLKADPFDPANAVFDMGSLSGGSRLHSALFTIAGEWGEILAAKQKFLEAAKESTIPGVKGVVLGAWQGPWGKIVFGGSGDNTYEGDDFIAIIDLGGNDVYKGRVASGIGLPGKAPLSFVLDLSGNDRYEGEDFTQGFGFNGIGILWDLGAGSDFYKSRFCSQACGLCGYGELFDDGGDDIYIADSGAQGAACFGYGHLIDAAGNDTYKGCRFVQAYANCMGVGVLTDGAGNDLYYAGGKYKHVPLHNDHYQSLSQGFSIGNRADGGGGTGGGVALLLDQGDGNDCYQADIYGQGASYWYSLGMLVDEGGNDTHTIFQYGLGGGIHLSTGILVNVTGNDTYTNQWGVGTGGAHDYAVGWLIDKSGTDFYQGNGQGQGLNFSFACLLDGGGDDSHCSNMAGNIGAGSNNDISLMLDLDGNDFYGVEGAKNGRFIRQGGHGLLYDCPSGGWFPSIDMSTLPTKQDPAPKSVKVQHILISYDGCGVSVLKGANSRTEQEAEARAKEVLKLARTKGADWKQLQVTYNEDSNEIGSNTHADYPCQADSKYIPEFKELAMALGVGQIGLSKKGKFGWHIIKRIE